MFDLFGYEVKPRPTFAQQQSKWNARWRANNKDKCRALSAARKKRVRQHTPAWVDRRALAAFYAARPLGHEVDHIIPLKGVTPEGWPVSGLHVLCNLQYLPSRENQIKHNNVGFVVPHDGPAGGFIIDPLAVRLCRLCGSYKPLVDFRGGAAVRQLKPAICSGCRRPKPKPVKPSKPMLSRPDEDGNLLCRHCQVQKPATQFYPNGKGGYLRICKPCEATRSKQRKRNLTGEQRARHLANKREQKRRRRARAARTAPSATP
jgi:hypothetical protein